MKIAKIILPMGAVASIILAIITQNWWKLPIAALFIFGYLEIIKAEKKAPSQSDKMDNN